MDVYSTESAGGTCGKKRNFGNFFGDILHILGGFGENFTSSGDGHFFSPPQIRGNIRISF